jgi:hypothetical protein
MANFSYPYPTYVPDKAADDCIAAIVSISPIAWLIQTCRAATVNVDEQYSKNVFTVTRILSAMGQRMIIVSNFILVMPFHDNKSRFSRAFMIGTMLCVVTTGVFMAPYPMLSPSNRIPSTPAFFSESYPPRFYSSLLSAMILEQNGERYDNASYLSDHYFECDVCFCRDLCSDSIVSEGLFYNQQT